jgi:hypothetical protein
MTEIRSKMHKDEVSVTDASSPRSGPHVCHSGRMRLSRAAKSQVVRRRCTWRLLGYVGSGSGGRESTESAICRSLRDRDGRPMVDPLMVPTSRSSRWRIRCATYGSSPLIALESCTDAAFDGRLRRGRTPVGVCAEKEQEPFHCILDSDLVPCRQQVEHEAGDGGDRERG